MDPVLMQGYYEQSQKKWQKGTCVHVQPACNSPQQILTTNNRVAELDDAKTPATNWTLLSFQNELVVHIYVTEEVRT